MSQDFQKIAEEAIKQCAEYEARINQLQEQIALTKKANLANPELVKKSVEALTKTRRYHGIAGRRDSSVACPRPTCLLKSYSGSVRPLH